MPQIKLVVWDLDNTLWNGTVYYTDKDSIELKPGTKEALKELTKRDIKNTICSKNYYEEAEKMLDKFEIKKYFGSAEVNWGLKSDNIRKLINKYNVKEDEVCFVDDDPFQRAEVLSQLPGIKAIELGDPLDILALDFMKPENETEEDKERVKILKEQRNREEAEKNHKGDYKEFLKSCNINMTIRSVEEKDWEIMDLTVSCRTMGRGIGSALLIAIMYYAVERKAKTIRGILREIESNWRMKPLYIKRGFKVIKKEGNETTYGYEFTEKLPEFHPWLKIERK